MIILKKSLTSSCAASAFTNNPFDGGNFQYTIGSGSLDIDKPVLITDLNTNDDANCGSAVVTYTDNGVSGLNPLLPNSKLRHQILQ